MLELKSDYNYLLGYSGHAYVIIDALNTTDNKVVGYFDVRQAARDPYQLIYCGSEQNVDMKAVVKNGYIFPAVGSNLIRRNLISQIEGLGLSQRIVYHASAIISTFSEIGLSTYIGAGVIINPCTSVGKGCIINTGVIIEHDCAISDFVHLAPGSVLTGKVSIGESVLIGANATLKPGITIGTNVIVGAGSVVLCDIPDNEVWVGNPARKIR